MRVPSRERLVLAVETTAPRCGAALARTSGDDVHLLAELHLAQGLGRAEDLAGCICEVLAIAGTTAKHLDGIAVSDGPGSFTALRVGLALVRGLAFPDGIEVAPVGSLTLVAECVSDRSARVCALLDASHRKVYVAGLVRDGGGWREEYEPSVVPLDDLEMTTAGWAGNWTTCGDGNLSSVLDLDVVTEPERAGVLARIGARRLIAGSGRAAATVLPRYVCGSGARLPESLRPTQHQR